MRLTVRESYGSPFYGVRRDAASNARLRPVMNRGQLGLLFKIASLTIGLWALLG